LPYETLLSLKTCSFPDCSKTLHKTDMKKTIIALSASEAVYQDSPDEELRYNDFAFSIGKI
jgi:hypothetical protein